ncbi:MAG TPA: L-serine ammonia-lyase, iron-sulfur-dependent, subunit alpha [Anaerolineaceae bacterium]|nr:L-serine ammonia-lyase, iron-sulfur-dependent, subunit alpha [Anaerolineaceae bacterium]
MQSIRELYRIGNGPSSSHTMAPKRAAEQFRARYPQANAYRVTLYGSLAATGKGHLTDRALVDALAPFPVEILWKKEEELPLHQNGMEFEAFQDGASLGSWQVYSLGGGALGEAGRLTEGPDVYELNSMAAILAHCKETGQSFWEYVVEREGPGIWEFLSEIWEAMQAAIDRGLRAEGVLPGGLRIQRRAWAFYRRAKTSGASFSTPGTIAAYALAVAEENASGGVVATAPTCGSSGVVPAGLRYVAETVECPPEAILRALATAGLVGNLIKHNASISGAEVGCQGEIGAACSMAAAAVTQLMGGTIHQIEYAAEMGLEHHLGLTCDPVNGLVQIPCIERNAFAATRAHTCADFALFSDGTHRIPFDDVVTVMKETGNALPSLYRETATGGLAAAYTRRSKKRSENC